MFIFIITYQWWNTQESWPYQQMPFCGNTEVIQVSWLHTELLFLSFQSNFPVIKSLSHPITHVVVVRKRDWLSTQSESRVGMWAFGEDNHKWSRNPVIWANITLMALYMVRIWCCYMMKKLPGRQIPWIWSHLCTSDDIGQQIPGFHSLGWQEIQKRTQHLWCVLSFKES